MLGSTSRTYTELGQLRTEVARVSGQLVAIGEFVTQARTERTDHETRIRALERWRYALPLSALASLAAVILTAVRLAGRG